MDRRRSKRKTSERNAEPLENRWNETSEDRKESAHASYSLARIDSLYIIGRSASIIQGLGNLSRAR